MPLKASTPEGKNGSGLASQSNIYRLVDRVTVELVRLGKEMVSIMCVKQDKAVPVCMTAIEKICYRLHSSVAESRTDYFYTLENICLDYSQKRVCFAEGPVRFCRSMFPQVHPYSLSPTEEILIAKYYSMEDVGGEEQFIDQIATLIVLITCPHEFLCSIPVERVSYDVESFWKEYESSYPILCMIRDALSGMATAK